MPSVSPLSPTLDRLLAVVGIIGLAVTTLIYPATSQIYAEPISFVYGLLLAIPVIAILFHSATQSSWVRPTHAWSGWVLGLGLVILASAWLSPYQSTVLRWSALPLAGIALFFWVHHWVHQSTKNRSELIIRGVAIATAVFSVVSLAQWTAKLLRRGFDPGLVEWLGSERNPFPLGHSNYTAGVLILGLPFMVRAAARSHTTARTAWIILTFLAIFTLVTTGSRGGILGLGVLSLLGVWHLKLRPRQLGLLLVTGLICGSALVLFHPRIGKLIEARDPSAPPNISSVQRLAMIEGGSLMGIDRPVLGWGLHSTPLVYPRYRGLLDGGAENVLQLHNAPIEIWAGLGSAGTLCCLVLLILCLRNWRRQPSAAIALLGYATFALTDYQLDVPIVVVAVACIAALLAPPTSVSLHLSQIPRILIAAGVVSTTGLVLLIGREDPTPRLNAAALTLAQDPQLANKAIALLEDSIALNPHQQIAHFNLGWLQVVRNPGKAEVHFRAALQLVPDKGGVYFGLGLACLNQNRPDRAARSFALECLSDPSFVQSPWWQVPAISDHRDATQLSLETLLDKLAAPLSPESWAARQLPVLHEAAQLLGTTRAGPQQALRRKRTGYPILMRNSNIPPPVDLFDVREYLDSTSGLPAKGWLPSPILLSLLDETVPAVQ